MTELQPNSKAHLRAPASLPKRDYVLLPLISVATVLVMFGSSEILTRIVWGEKATDPCIIYDGVAGNRSKPNCTILLKNAEGPAATYRFNECGYRSPTSCGPKPPGVSRIVVLGSSTSEGMFVPYEETYFARTASELERVCGCSVDVQNLAVIGSSPLYVYRRLAEIVALRPDVVIYPLGPFDLEQQIDAEQLSHRDSPPRIQSKQAVTWHQEPMKRLQLMLTQSRTMLVAQHFIFKNRDTYLRLYMLYGDKADFLRQPLTAAWRRRLADFDLIVGDLAERFRTAGVPLIIIPVPSRAEAALLSSSHLPPRVDPFDFGRQIDLIAVKHGVGYLDLMEPFSRIPNSENLYYVADGHPTSNGHKVIAQNLIQKLQDGSVPAFSHCSLKQAAKEYH